MALRIRSRTTSSSSSTRWIACIAGCLAMMPSGFAQTTAGATRLVSATADGLPVGDAWGSDPGPNVVSADGRFVVFTSRSATVVPGDPNDRPDVFVRDMLAGNVERVNVGPGGVEAN